MFKIILHFYTEVTIDYCNPNNYCDATNQAPGRAPANINATGTNDCDVTLRVMTCNLDVRIGVILLTARGFNVRPKGNAIRQCVLAMIILVP